MKKVKLCPRRSPKLKFGYIFIESHRNLKLKFIRKTDTGKRFELKT